MENTGKTHLTERSGVAILMNWMREIINKHNLDLGYPDVETGGTDRKMPDLVIYESRRSKQVLCLLEAKPPYFDVFDEEELKEPARRKSNQRNAKYFALTNFRKLIWFDTERANKPIPEEQQIIQKYDLSVLTNLDQLEETRFKTKIKQELEDFLLKLYAVHTGKEAEPQIAIDEFLITRIQEKVNLLAYYYRQIIEEKFFADGDFAQSLQLWFFDQAWNFAGTSEDFDKAARQTAYLLVNKIIFYDVLQTKRPEALDPLDIPDSMTKGKGLQRHLQGYFSDALEIDYENVFSTDFVDELAFPDSNEVINEIKRLVALLNRYNFATLGFDVIGAIFERLIPEEERHILGQYFTSADVVDLILNFCLQNEKDIVLDPSCGAGTFLVRAYQQKKLLNQRLSHEDNLDTIWGNDIAKFPAHLSIINLAINDLGVDVNYPNVIQEDFFAIQHEKEGINLDAWRERMAKTLRGKEREIVYPKYFDAIVGNPPYTRQEEIEDINTEDVTYKENLIQSALKSGGEKLATISKRAGIHAYFFVHGTKFLKEGGRFGFIVSNSWLDANYGSGLQEFFLKNYKITAIIESKVERWFAEADVNTCIVIMEKCSDAKERDNNLVRFVYLKKRLRDFIEPTSQIWESSISRKNQIESLRKTILAHNDIYENEEMRVFPISQNELWEEGFDEEKNRFVGAKWGKYLRAPEIYFEILQKCKDKLVPLKELAKVRFGIKTGANDFFYLTEKEIEKHKIEWKFWTHKNKKGKTIPNKVILRASEVSTPTISPDNLQNLVLFIKDSLKKLRKKNIEKYIEKGKREKYDERPTCASREPSRNWFDLGEDISDLIAFPQRFRKRHIVLHNPERVSLNKNLYGVEPKNKDLTKSIALILNSTLIAFWLEFVARQPGGGGAPLDVDVYVSANLLIPKAKELLKRKKDFEKIKLLEREIGSIFEELGAFSPSEVSFEKVRKDRLELDKIILQDILGLTETEHLEIYRAVIDLVSSRLSRAKSVTKRSNSKGGSVDDAMRNNLTEDLLNGD